MPLDFEEILQSLVDVGAVAINSTPDGDRGAFRAVGPDRSSEAQLDFGEDDLEFLLEQIEFHEQRHSFLGALTLIRRGLEHAPEEARLHHRMAVVQARGLHHLVAGMEAARMAVELEPGRREFVETLDTIDRLVEREAVRRIFKREFPVTDVHFVGWDAAENCVWVLTRSRLQPDRVRMLGIDIARDTIVHSETHDDAHDLQVVWSQNADQGQRPTLFRATQRPAAVSRTGVRWAFERHPESGDAGVWITDGEGKNLRTIDNADSRFFGLAFSPDEKWITWRHTDSDKTLVGLASVSGGRSLYPFATTGPVEVFWSTRGDRLVVYEADSGIVWTVTTDGNVEEIGVVRAGWSRVVTDASRSTGAVIYDEADGTEILWVDLSTGAELASHRFDQRPSDFILRADGCLVARTREGALAVDLSVGREREIAGVRIAPGCFRNTRWINGHPLVVMTMRPNAVELISLDVGVLLA